MILKIKIFLLFFIVISTSQSAGGICSDPLSYNGNISPVIKKLVQEGKNFTDVWPIAVKRAESNPEEFPVIAWDKKNNISSISQKENRYCGKCDIVYAYTRHDIDLFGFVNTYLSCSGKNYSSTFLPGRNFVESFRQTLSNSLSGRISECSNAVEKTYFTTLYRSQAKFIPFEFVDGIYTNYMFLSTSANPKAGAMQYYVKDKKYYFVMKIRKSTVVKHLKCSAYPHEDEVLLGIGQKWRDITNKSILEVLRIVRVFESEKKEINKEDIRILENVL